MVDKNSTVNFNSRLLDILKQIALKEERTVQEVIEQAIQEYCVNHFLEEANKSLDPLRKVSETWKMQLEKQEEKF